MYFLIANPVAGNGMGKRVADQVCERLTELDKPFFIHWTQYHNHASQLAKQAVLESAETVIAIGGDGTISEVAQGLMHSKTALGIIPAGTGNDFIKTVGIPSEWEEALSFLFDHPARCVNTGTINDRFFLNVCGTGFDVMVIDYAESAKKKVRGLLPYLYGVIRSIAHFVPREMTIQMDDLPAETGFFTICSVANGCYFGGGIPIAPFADINDNQLDVLLVDAIARWKLPFYLPALLMGTLHKCKVAKKIRCQSVKVVSEQMRVNIDGEIIDATSAAFHVNEKELLLHW